MLGEGAGEVSAGHGRLATVRTLGMILTSNRGFAGWGNVLGDPVVATALLDRLLNHFVVIRIEGSTYRMREHAALVPENVRSGAAFNPPPQKRHDRPPKKLSHYPEYGRSPHRPGQPT